MFSQKRKSRASVIIAVAALVTATILMSGCGSKAQSGLSPKISPPAIKVAGTLRAGIDMTHPPFGGVDHGKQAGLDLDTAAALAQKLGLKLEVVSVMPSEAATALAQGKVDAVFSVPFSDGSLTSVSLAGSYVSDAPAFFIATDSTASVSPSMTLDTLSATRVAVQQGSAAYWKLLSELGSGSVKPYSTLRSAMDALNKGKVSVVGGDALVGGYIARDFPRVHFAGQLDSAVPIGVAVAPENSKLGDSIRQALDSLAADGVFDAIRQKWVGDLPKLRSPTSTESSVSTSPSVNP